MKISFIIFLIFINTQIIALDLNLDKSAIHNATSGIALIYDSPSATSINPAFNPALCNPGIETAATYLFDLKELPYYNLHSAFKIKSFGLYLGDHYLDHEFYKENILNFALNYRLSNLSCGLSLRYLSNKVENYHNDSSLIFDLGLAWKINNISSAIAVRNITQATFIEEKLPTVYLWESCYQVTDKSKIAVALEKEDDFSFCFKLAARYDIFKLMSILSSYQFNPDRIGVGMVFNVSGFSVVYSVRTHQSLDLTHYISVGYVFKM